MKHIVPGRAARIPFFILMAAPALLSPAMSLFDGIMPALTMGNPFRLSAGRASKLALQASVGALAVVMAL